MVVAERFNRIDFRDPTTFKLIKSVAIPWRGTDHGDFTIDGRYWLGSTEYTGVVVKIDVVAMKLVDYVRVGRLPIDVRLAPDGTKMFVANQGSNGVTVLDPDTLRILKFIRTGYGAHGFQVSRDTKRLFVGNCRGGTISVIDIASLRIVKTWRVGGSPDMMQMNWADPALRLQPIQRIGFRRGYPVGPGREGPQSRFTSARLDVFPEPGCALHRPQRRLPLSGRPGCRAQKRGDHSAGPLLDRKPL